MAFDWNSYLTLAKNLKNETDGQVASTEVEAKQRSAISRAYYAVYHLAEDYAKQNLGYVTSKTGQNQYHSDVRSVFRSQMGNPDHQEVGKILFQLHKNRKDCDYEEKSLGNLESLLTTSVLNAEKIQTTLAN